MRCYGCGAELPEGSKYCLSCGKKVGEKGGEGSEKSVEGQAEHIKVNNKKRVPVKFPLVFDIIIGLSALILLVLLYFAFKS